MIIISTGVGVVAGLALTFPMANLSTVDSKCRIGIPPKVTIPLLFVDVIFSLALTGVFINELVPLLSFLGKPAPPKKLSDWLSCKLWPLLRLKEDDARLLYPTTRRVLTNINALLWKSVLASAVAVIPSIINVVILIATKSREHGWVCLSFCSVDLALGVLIVHMLTVDPSAVEKDPGAKA